LILFGVMMLFPYPRQSLFGPTIRGKPWCEWEDAIRSNHAERGDGPLADVMMFLRRFVFPEPEQMADAELFDHPEMLPLVIALLDDPSPSVRGACIFAIEIYPNIQDASAVPALTKRFEDDVLKNRLEAGIALWRVNKDRRIVPVCTDLLKNGNADERFAATNSVSRLGADFPELFPHVAAHAKDANPLIRQNVMYAMDQFGSKGVPILVTGLKDANAGVRHTAVAGLYSLGPVAKDAAPALEACFGDADSYVAGVARAALRRIDPKRVD
jgi:HEAT repeat protein